MAPSPSSSRRTKAGTPKDGALDLIRTTSRCELKRERGAGSGAGKPVYDVMAMGNGALAGLVAVTAGCSVVPPWAAIIIGAIAGCLYCIGSTVSVRVKVLPIPPSARRYPPCASLTYPCLAPFFNQLISTRFGSLAPAPQQAEAGPRAPNQHRPFPCCAQQPLPQLMSDSPTSADPPALRRAACSCS